MYIYFIQAVSGGPIKIGFTKKRVESRLAALQVGNPQKLRVVAVVSAERSHEAKLHRYLAPFRAMGEWYHDTPEVRQVIEQCITKKRLRKRMPKPILLSPGERIWHVALHEELARLRIELRHWLHNKIIWENCIRVCKGKIELRLADQNFALTDHGLQDLDNLIRNIENEIKEKAVPKS